MSSLTPGVLHAASPGVHAVSERLSHASSLLAGAQVTDTWGHPDTNVGA